MSGNFSSVLVRSGNVRLEQDRSDLFRLHHVKPGYARLFEVISV